MSEIDKKIRRYDKMYYLFHCKTFHSRNKGEFLASNDSGT